MSSSNGTAPRLPETPPLSSRAREVQRHNIVVMLGEMAQHIDAQTRTIEALTKRAASLDTRLAALESVHVYAMTRTRWQRLRLLLGI